MSTRHFLTGLFLGTAALCGVSPAQECSPDTVPPTMVLVGSITQVVELGSEYVDPGVSAFDNCDGNVSGRVIRTGDIDTGKPGVYVLRYDVVDLAGNAAPPIFRQPVVTELNSAPCDPVVECPPNPIAPGGNATFTVTNPCLQSGIVYQLLFNGAVIQTSDSGSFTIDQVDCDDAGWYTIAISNAVTTIYVRCELIIEPCGEGEGQSEGATEGEGEGADEQPPCDLFPTCFSGLQYPLPSTTPYAANTSGFVMARINVQEPPVFPTPPPVNDQNWQPPMDHNEAGVPWTANVLGQVFGIALDNATPPNMYVTATSVYGDFPAGPGGYGAVYRVDGVTGVVCVLATLPNAGPALGNICYDEVNSQLFVSNHEDGLIYRIPIDNTCT
ncbi:MAG: hypothetical protein RLZZ303_907, partial [Candidatus Hydrogenedentota bacterium]